MKNNPKISVIIPFFNAQIYLKTAIKSVLNQNFKDFELILINDGSTDNSATIAKQFKNNHTKIHYIKSDNNGPGIARNLGIANAKGTYLVFLDADDQFTKNALVDLHTCITSTKSDLVIARHKMLASNGNEISTTKLFKNRILTKKQAIEAFLKNEIIPTSWAKIYRTKIVKKCVFPNLFWKEDNIFILNYLNKSKKISFLNAIVLINHCRKNSLTRQIISVKMITDIFKSYILQEELISNKLKALFIEQQIKTLLDLFLIFKIDYKKIKTNKKNISSLLKKRASILASSNINLNFKKRVHIYLLNLSNYIGVSFVLLLLSLIENKQIKRLKKIKY